MSLDDEDEQVVIATGYPKSEEPTRRGNILLLVVLGGFLIFGIAVLLRLRVFQIGFVLAWSTGAYVSERVKDVPSFVWALVILWFALDSRLRSMDERLQRVEHMLRNRR